MAAKQLRFDTDARDRMLKGVNTLADAVKAQGVAASAISTRPAVPKGRTRPDPISSWALSDPLVDCWSLSVWK